MSLACCTTASSSRLSGGPICAGSVDSFLSRMACCTLPYGFHARRPTCRSTLAAHRCSATYAGSPSAFRCWRRCSSWWPALRAHPGRLVGPGGHRGSSHFSAVDHLDVQPLAPCWASDRRHHLCPCTARNSFAVKWPAAREDTSTGLALGPSRSLRWPMATAKQPAAAAT